MEHLASPSCEPYSGAGTSSYGQSLVELAAERAELVVMAAQSPAPLRGLNKALGKRFIDVGLCDETLVGAAAGLALRGRTPVVHASASVLAQRAFELVRTEVGRSPASGDARRVRAGRAPPRRASLPARRSTTWR